MTSRILLSTVIAQQMKRITKKSGWDEVSTVSIEVTLKDTNPFQTAGGWVDFCKRMPKLAKDGRTHCQLCLVRWEDEPPESNTYFVQTTKGNKILCQECFNKIEAPEIHSKRNDK